MKLPSRAAALVVLGLASLAQAPVPSQPVPSQAEGHDGMVSSAHPLATEAGIEILRAGGSAFDAAVAVAAALNVVEPAMSGMGGYGTIVVFDAAKQESWFLNSSGRIPAALNSDAFRAPTPDYLANRRGAKSFSTPGNVHAWEAMSRKYGKLPWQRLFDPAIALGERGFLMDERAAGLLDRMFPEFPAHAKALFGRDGHALRSGDRLVQRDLAASLRLVATNGAAAFYTGAIGKAIDAEMRRRGGFLTLADLERDRAEWWKPISIRYRGHDVVTASPPANSFDYLVRLGIMSRFDLRGLGHNSAEYLHRFAEATKHRFLGPPAIRRRPRRRAAAAAVAARRPVPGRRRPRGWT